MLNCAYATTGIFFFHRCSRFFLYASRKLAEWFVCLCQAVYILCVQIVALCHEIEWKKKRHRIFSFGISVHERTRKPEVEKYLITHTKHGTTTLLNSTVKLSIAQFYQRIFSFRFRFRFQVLIPVDKLSMR